MLARPARPWPAFLVDTTATRPGDHAV